MTKKRSDTTKLLDEIIAQNTALMKGKADDDIKFKAQDRILKALTLKERQQKKNGTKFDLGNT